MAKKTITVETPTVEPTAAAAAIPAPPSGNCSIVNLRDNPARAKVSVINDALKSAIEKGSEFILFVANVDRLIEPTEIKQLKALLDANPNVCAATAAVKGWHKFGTSEAQNTELPFFGFHTVLIRRSALVEIGGELDKSFTYFWGSDVDLGAQLRHKGYVIALCKDVKVNESEKGSAYPTAQAENDMRQRLTEKYGLGDADKANETLKNGFDFDFSPFLKKKV